MLVIDRGTARRRHRTGEQRIIRALHPVVEAAAHLDADRRAALFDELSALGGQAWLTGTEAFLFEAFGDRAQKVRVEEGKAVSEA